MLKGMYGNSEAGVQSLDRSFAVVNQKTEKGKLLMACYTGLLSVSTEGYLGADKWSWNLQPREMISHRLDHLNVGTSILACHLSQDEEQKINTLRGKGFLVTEEENPGFALYKVTQSF